MKGICYFESVAIGVKEPNWYAAFNLGQIFYYGVGVPKDLNRVLKVFDAETMSAIGTKKNQILYLRKVHTMKA